MKKLLILSVIKGLLITLITGLLNTTPSDLVGSTWYGWPFAWRYVPVVLEPVASYDAVHFIMDVIIWTIVAFILRYLWLTFRGKEIE
jgi:hypothetical protein